MFGFMSKCKMVVASMLVFSAIGSASASAATTPGNEQPINSQTFSKVTDVMLQGEKIGTRNVTVKYDRKVVHREVTVTLHTTSIYNLNPTVSSEMRALFQNSNKDDVIKETVDKKYFWNGKQVTNTNTATTASNALFMNSGSPDTGGIPNICHYYGDYQTYSYACYQGMTTNSTPTGSNITKIGIPFSNAYTNRAQGTIDIFTGDYNNLMASEEAFVVASGIAILGIETIIGFIAGGVGAVSAAVLVKTEYDICNSDLQKAYGYIGQM